MVLALAGDSTITSLVPVCPPRAATTAPDSRPDGPVADGTGRRQIGRFGNQPVLGQCCSPPGGGGPTISTSRRSRLSAVTRQPGPPRCASETAATPSRDSWAPA